jgi:hypothetical protein
MPISHFLSLCTVVQRIPIQKTQSRLQKPITSLVQWITIIHSPISGQFFATETTIKAEHVNIIIIYIPYFTVHNLGSKEWHPLESGLPTVKTTITYVTVTNIRDKCVQAVWNVINGANIWRHCKIKGYISFKGLTLVYTHTSPKPTLGLRTHKPNTYTQAFAVTECNKTLSANSSVRWLNGKQTNTSRTNPMLANIYPYTHSWNMTILIKKNNVLDSN